MASDAELTAQAQREDHEIRLEEPPSRRWWALAVIAIAQLMIVLDGTVVNIALPTAQTGPRHLQRRPAVGDHRLHPRVRWPAAAGRPDRRLHRTQAHLHHRPARLRCGVRARWCGADRAHAVRRPRAPGRVRGADGARALSIVTVTFTEAKERAKAFGVYGAHLRRWRGDRPDRRRRPDRVRVVALVPLINVPIAIVAFIAGAILVHESKADGNTRTTSRRVLGTVGSGRAGLRIHRGAPRPVSAGLVGLERPSSCFVVVAVILLVAFVLVEMRVGEPAAADAGGARPQPRRLVPRRRCWSSPGCSRCSCS